MCVFISNYDFDLNNLNYINKNNNKKKTSSYLFIFIIKKNKKAIISIIYAYYKCLLCVLSKPFFFSVEFSFD